VDDGLLSFTVVSIDEAASKVHCIVDNAGFLGENKGINLPGYLPDDLPALRAKDLEDIKVRLILITYLLISIDAPFSLLFPLEQSLLPFLA
jgi:pyruvate kinase